MVHDSWMTLKITSLFDKSVTQKYQPWFYLKSNVLKSLVDILIHEFLELEPGDFPERL